MIFPLSDCSKFFSQTWFVSYLTYVSFFLYFFPLFLFLRSLCVGTAYRVIIIHVNYRGYILGFCKKVALSKDNVLLISLYQFCLGQDLA